MIPLQKLNSLNRSQRLRKSAKIFGDAEHRFIASGQIEPGEKEYLENLLDLLAGDKDFSTAATEALETARAHLASAGAAENSSVIRRVLNSAYHLLLAETGHYPADWDFIEADSALDPSKRRIFPGMQVYLEDIRSPFNVGSMFRAAESFGAEKIWLSPLCADPRHKRSERTAMGCVDVLHWERLPHEPFSGPYDTGGGTPRTAALPFSGVPLFTLETGGIPLAEFPFPPRAVLIAGSEELGVSPGALTAADASLGRVSIPTWGAKGSLNVSVAFGILMHAWALYLAKL